MGTFKEGVLQGIEVPVADITNIGLLVEKSMHLRRSRKSTSIEFSNIILNSEVKH